MRFVSATKAKPYDIPISLIYRAWFSVRANRGCAGVDGEALEQFERKLDRNLYAIWNKMSSGSYFPPPVKAVAIPKKNGGERILGIPTVGDRVAQTVVKILLEERVEPIFLDDSYGYRPKKSAQDAIAVTRERCWKYDWVLEFDIKGLFDNIDHALLMKAVEKHVELQWMKLYIRRWLTAPLEKADGTIVERTTGTPQGGVVSPVLANLFLHYTFDMWMKRNHPANPWCRYADDGLVHCRTEAEAEAMKSALAHRLEQCHLEMHPEKTKIVYCKDGRRKNDHDTTKFDFLGYHFRRRIARNKSRNQLFLGYLPAASSSALKAMRNKIRSQGWRNRADWNLQQIADVANPLLRGWINYYGAFYASALYTVFNQMNRTLVAWARHKYLRFRYSKTRAVAFLESILKRRPNLFVHWGNGTIGSFV